MADFPSTETLPIIPNEVKEEPLGKLKGGLSARIASERGLSEGVKAEDTYVTKQLKENPYLENGNQLNLNLEYLKMEFGSDLSIINGSPGTMKVALKYTDRLNGQEQIMLLLNGVALQDRNNIWADVRCKIHKQAQNLFKYRSVLQAVPHVKGIIKNARGDFVGYIQDPAKGTPLSSYDKSLQGEAIDQLAAALKHNIEATKGRDFPNGFVHGDLFQGVPDALDLSSDRLNETNIFVQERIDSFGQIRQTLQFIDYGGTGENTVAYRAGYNGEGSTAYTIHDPEYAQNEPNWLRIALMNRNERLKKTATV